MEKLVTVEDIMRRYNKTYKQVIYALITGRLKGKKLGWQWVVNVRDLPEKWPERTKKKHKQR